VDERTDCGVGLSSVRLGLQDKKEYTKVIASFDRNNSIHYSIRKKLETFIKTRPSSRGT
jgi:hypothetical protein